MPKLKTLKIEHRDEAGDWQTLTVNINISSDGLFYANLPANLWPAFSDTLVACHAPTPAGRFRAEATTLDALEREIRRAWVSFMAPEITEEPVILYNIESHVSFALDNEGRIVPNAGFPGAAWPATQKGDVQPSYGDHHATKPAESGYSLAIGARAMIKKTYRFGDKVVHKYELFYRGGHHHGRENPAELLNSWTAMGLGKEPREMPYSDDAALFFHRMLLGMAELSRRIQESTFTQERLSALIASSTGIPLLTTAAGPNTNSE